MSTTAVSTAPNLTHPVREKVTFSTRFSLYGNVIHYSCVFLGRTPPAGARSGYGGGVMSLTLPREDRFQRSQMIRPGELPGGFDSGFAS